MRPLKNPVLSVLRDNKIMIIFTQCLNQQQQKTDLLCPTQEALNPIIQLSSQLTVGENGSAEHLHVALDVPLLGRQRGRMLARVQAGPGPLLKLERG